MAKGSECCKIGVHFPTVPRMLREAILGFLRGQQDLEVVTMSDVCQPSLELLAKEGLDVLITEGVGRSTGADGLELLSSLSRLKVIVIEPGSRDATVTRLVLETEHLPEISAETLLRAIREGPAFRPSSPQ
jgi:DNA-binding NarL/FixJ family response regulator